MERKDYLHNPTHIFLDNSFYFITAAIYKKRRLIEQTKLKEFLLDCIQSCFTRYGWEVQHWVILDNHYHLLVKSRRGLDLPKIMQQIHSSSGYQIKKETQTKELPIWWNYWDYCPRDERDYMIRVNYLYNNPIKHGYVANLNDYLFSSFHDALKINGREYMVKQFKYYPEYKTILIDDDY